MRFIYSNLILILILLLAETSYSDIACDRTTVANAISSAEPGDTVTLNASCSETWSDDITITTNDLTISGQTCCNRDNSTFEVTCNDSTEIAGGFFNISADNVRITGFTSTATTTIAISEGATDWRIDHCHFNGNSRLIQNLGYSYGVFDNNLVENNQTGEFVFESEGDNNAVDGPASWARGGGWDDDYDFGAMIVEDSEFDITSSGPAISNWGEGNNGGRWVVRYCLFSDDSSYKLSYWFEVHGEPKYPAGQYSWALYGNKLNSTNTDWHSLSKFRGGRGLFYNNTLAGWTGSSSPTVNLNEDDCSGCGSYPCEYQINNTYIWNNSLNGGDIKDTATNCSSHIQEDRDFWDDLGASDTNFFTGTSRPGTCAINDCYWETDNKALYRCTATDTWSLIYTPHTYPHPLRSGQTTGCGTTPTPTTPGSNGNGCYVDTLNYQD